MQLGSFALKEFTDSRVATERLFPDLDRVAGGQDLHVQPRPWFWILDAERKGDRPVRHHGVGFLDGEFSLLTPVFVEELRGVTAGVLQEVAAGNRAAHFELAVVEVDHRIEQFVLVGIAGGREQEPRFDARKSGSEAFA